MKLLASCFMAIGVLAGGASQAAGIRAAGVDHVGINVPDLKQAEAFFKSLRMRTGDTNRAIQAGPNGVARCCGFRAARR